MSHRILVLLALVLVFSLVLAPASPVSAQETATEGATAKPVDELVVGCWNLLNLFDNHDSPFRPDEGTAPKSRADLRHLAAQIDRLGLDVLGVAEVENREILEILNGHLQRPFAFIELIEGNDFRGIDVGILSRFPIESATSHRQMPLEGEHRFARDFPIFRLHLAEGRNLDVGVVHLKSKLGKKAESDAWRRAEALGIARIVSRRRELEPAVPVLVMGDFNDDREALTLAPVFAAMKDLTSTVPLDERYSFVHDGKGEQIDFILGAGELEVAAARIEHETDRVSDHYPVVTRLAMPVKLPRVELPAGGAAKEPEERISLAADDLETMTKHLLQEVIIEGKVTQVHRSKKGDNATLNFAKDFTKAISVHVPALALDRLGDLDALVGKKVRISGPLHLYRGRPQIVWTRPEQKLE